MIGYILIKSYIYSSNGAYQGKDLNVGEIGM